MKKVVLHLIETSGPGGAEKMLIHLAEHLDRSRYAPLVCLLKDGWLNLQLQSRGIETVILSQKTNSLDPGWLFKLRKVLRARNVSLMHSHEFAMNTYAGMASVISGVPVVATVHGRNYYWQKWRRRAAYRFLSRRCQMVAVSQDIKTFLIERVGIRSSRVRTIYNGVDYEVYSRDARAAKAIREEFGLVGGQPIVGSVGNLYPVKGHSYLVEAAATVAQVFPSVVFLIAGRGGLREQLEQRVRELGIEGNIKFLGFREDVPSLLGAMDLFVLPSLSEGLPLSALEAMASAKSVVATNVGGNPEVVVNGETGFLVPPADPAALAEKISLLLGDPGLALQLGANGRARVEKEFSLESMMGKYLELYESVC